MRRLGRRRSNRRILFLIIVVLAADIILFAVFSARLRPMIEAMAVCNSKLFAQRVINDAVGDTIKSKEIDYDKLMILDKNDNGTITAIKSNTMLINMFKYDVTEKALENVENIDDSKLGIPIGNLLDTQMLSNLGPRIPVHVEPFGNAETKIVNSFTDAGINQTRQQITLDVTVNLTVLVAGYKVNTSVTTNYLIADTVIVGEVPDSYTVIDDSALSDSAAPKIYAYGKND